MAADFAESEDWLVHDLMPAVLEAGLEREAVVLPSGALSTIADGRVRGFTDMDLAKQWLLEGALP